jgi:hypothetical protein
MYMDDVGSVAHNPWCGELAAVSDFNAASTVRKIAPFNFLRETRLFKNAKWLSHMYTLHVLDHPVRFSVLEKYGYVVLDNPYLKLDGQER